MFRAVLTMLLLLAGCATTRYEAIPEKSLDEFPSIYPERRLQLDFRMSIRYVARGESPAVVFLHGLGGDHHQWNLTMPAVLARGWRVVALDFPGHGKSSRAEGYPYGVASNARATLAVMDALGIEKAVLVGSSMGGMTALYLAIHHPERVRALALAAPVGVAPFGPLEWGLVRLGMWAGAASWFDEGWLRMTVMPMTFEKNVDHPLVEAFLRKALLQIRDPKANALFDEVLLTCFDSISETPTWRDLSRIRVPVWAVWGDRDAQSDPHNRGLLPRAIAGARVGIYRGVGHCPPLEVPERFNRDLLSFLSNLPEHTGEKEGRDAPGSRGDRR